jgi:hypothetical protein
MCEHYYGEKSTYTAYEGRHFEGHKKFKIPIMFEVEALNKVDAENMLIKFLEESQYVYSRFQKCYVPIQKTRKGKRFVR